MTQDLSNLDILELYLRQELLMSSLYGRFSAQFDDFRDDWKRLAAEELEHAQWIQHLRERLKGKGLLFREGKARRASLESLVSYLEKTIEEFDASPFELKKAGFVALDFERSLIEKKIFECFESDAKEFAEILTVLSSEQHAHIGRIEQLAERIRNRD